ncbi:MAG: FxsA family protein [Acidimicrobiia bacterium]|nr:FxsA family protein [Acidimicrobiia bacterium]
MTGTIDGVLPLLVVLFVIVPLVELAVIIQVADRLGLLETIGLLLVVSVVGAWMVKVQGLGVLRRMQDQLAAGTVPGAELVNGVLVLVAGALLLTPGFVTDATGLLLLLPPVRAVLRRWMRRRLLAGVEVHRWDGGGSEPRDVDL